MIAESADDRTLARRVVATMMAKDAFSNWLGLVVVDVEPDRVTIRMTVREDMLNAFGVCHGGVTFAFADSAFAFASNSHGRVSLSVENGITYPTSVSAGDVLTAVAEKETGSKRLGFYRVTVRRSEEIVALFHGTVYRTDRELQLDE